MDTVLRSSTWVSDRNYRTLSYRFRVRSNLPRAARLLDRLLAPFRARDAAGGNGVPTYSLVGTGEGRFPYALYLDDDCIQQVEYPASMVDYVLAHSTTRAIELAAGFVAVHAGAATWNGRGILLPAPPDSGKTTLVAGLVRAGFGYLSDETGLVDPEDGLLHPFPRPLAMDDGSIGALPGLRQKLPPDHQQYMRFRYHIPPSDLRSGALGRPCPVRYVVAPRYQGGGKTLLEPISRAAGLTTLVDNSFNFPRFGRRGLTALGDVVRGAECYRLQIGDLPSAVQVVRDLVGAP
jgi:hypothetical protein